VSISRKQITEITFVLSVLSSQSSYSLWSFNTDTDTQIQIQIQQITHISLQIHSIYFYALSFQYDCPPMLFAKSSRIRHRTPNMIWAHEGRQSFG